MATPATLITAPNTCRGVTCLLKMNLSGIRIRIGTVAMIVEATAELV